jgi:hypothetical protein
MKMLLRDMCHALIHNSETVSFSTAMIAAPICVVLQGMHDELQQLQPLMEDNVSLKLAV